MFKSLVGLAAVLLPFVLLLVGCTTAPKRVCDCTVVSNPEIDRVASAALYSYPKVENAEFFSGVYGNFRIPEPQKLDRMGGYGKVYADPLAIIHTHPIMENSNWHGNDTTRPAPHDVDAVLQLKVPNYYRSHNGRQVFVIEILNGVVTTRAVTLDHPPTI